MSEITEKLNRTDNDLANMARSWKEIADNPEAIKQALVNQYGLNILDNPQEYNQKAFDYTESLRKKALQDLVTIQDRMKKTYEEMETARQRRIVRRTNGQVIAQDYADQHKIPIDDAIKELDDYASRKRSKFNPDSLSDQYAALKNIASLDGQDKDTAQKILNKQLEGAETRDQKLEREHYGTIAKMTPGAMLDYYAGSRWAYAKLGRPKD